MNTPQEPRPRPRLSTTGEDIDSVTGGGYMSGNNPSSNQWSAPTPPSYNPQYQYPQAPQFPPNDVAGKKIAAGICGIFIGALGIHKFILGYNSAGLIMLLVSVLTCGIGAIPMTIIGLIEGIIYLTKSDQEFQQQYGNNQKPWF